MQKNQLIYLVQNYLGGGNVTDDVKKKYRRGIIDYQIGMVYNDYMVRIFLTSSVTLPPPR